MPRRRSRRMSREAPELNITAFLNLMVVLVPFLLITAVFSRITILELNLPPASTQTNEPEKKEVKVEVIVRENSIEYGNGDAILARFDKDESGQYDIEGLSDVLRNVKQQNPEKLDSSLLLEPEIEYDVLIAVMDAVREAEVIDTEATIDESNPVYLKIELFPEISVGDAPGRQAGASQAGASQASASQAGALQSGAPLSVSRTEISTTQANS